MLPFTYTKLSQFHNSQEMSSVINTDVDSWWASAPGGIPGPLHVHNVLEISGYSHMLKFTRAVDTQ